MVGRGRYPGSLRRQPNNQGVTSSASHETGYNLKLWRFLISLNKSTKISKSDF